MDNWYVKYGYVAFHEGKMEAIGAAMALPISV
jgi:hypothetical protein